MYSPNRWYMYISYNNNGLTQTNTRRPWRAILFSTERACVFSCPAAILIRFQINYLTAFDRFSNPKFLWNTMFHIRILLQRTKAHSSRSILFHRNSLIGTYDRTMFDVCHVRSKPNSVWGWQNLKYFRR